MSRQVAAGLLLFAAVLGVTAVRVVTASRGELLRGQALEARGDDDAALLHYRRSAHWYAPGNPYCVHALEALERMALRTEPESPARALSAWRAIHASAVTARWLRQPHPSRLARADRNIARLMSSDPVESLPEIEEADIAAGLQAASERPHVLWVLLVVLGFVVWVGGAFSLALRGIDSEGRVQRASVRVHAAAIAFGWAGFLVGLGFA